MIDTEKLLSDTCLLELIERDTRPAKGTRLFCPFCQCESSNGPALQVYDRRYHCFGCGAGGDAIEYVIRRDNVDFKEACIRLGWKGEAITSDELQKSQMEYSVKRQESDNERAERLAQLLAEYTTEEIWLAYQSRMSEDNMDWWANQGIPHDWQLYLRLGFTPDKLYFDKDKVLRHSPAYTIPYFHDSFIFKNMQYRLQNPVNPKDRYRFEGELKTTYYMVSPDEPIGDKVIICEGAKKGMVLRIRGSIDDDIAVLCIPSKVDFGGIADVVKDCGIVWIIPDPDAWTKPINASPTWIPSPIKLARQIGKQVRIVRLPIKVDDGLLQFDINVKKYMAMAVKP